MLALAMLITLSVSSTTTPKEMKLYGPIVSEARKSCNWHKDALEGGLLWTLVRLEVESKVVPSYARGITLAAACRESRGFRFKCGDGGKSCGVAVVEEVEAPSEVGSVRVDCVHPLMLPRFVNDQVLVVIEPVLNRVGDCAFECLVNAVAHCV